MLLSVSVWSGAEPATRDLFHWISALIAFPALVYSGRVFFRSAWRALRHGQTNMDVPISIGVLLAFGMSLYETLHHGPHAYFDAAISLLFFLLIGRTLDHMMREQARTAVKGLARLAPRGALVVQHDGTHAYLPVERDRAGHDDPAGRGRARSGRWPWSKRTIRPRLLAGLRRERCRSRRRRARCCQAGTLNLTGPLTIAATAAAKDSFLAEMVRMMEAAEAGRSAYRRIADRAARLYAPVVHLTALLTFIGWMIADRRPAPRGHHRHRGADHHLPLRARPCRAHGAGRRRAAAVRERHHGQGWRRAGAPRRSRHRGLRQDRHADHGSAAAHEPQ